MQNVEVCDATKDDEVYNCQLQKHFKILLVDTITIKEINR